MNTAKLECRSVWGAMAATAAMAAQFASLALSSPSSASRVSLSSSFLGQKSAFCIKKRVNVPNVRPRGLEVRAQGGFIPAEHRWMYEGVEKMGPVSFLSFLALWRFWRFYGPLGAGKCKCVSLILAILIAIEIILFRGSFVGVFCGPYHVTLSHSSCPHVICSII